MNYKKPGRYYAICNNGRFDGHYVKEFELPENETKCGAAWWFLNRVDGEACLDAVYPIDIFPKK